MVTRKPPLRLTTPPAPAPAMEAKSPRARAPAGGPSLPGRRERLLAAARARVFSLGYDRTRMEDVASDAGFSKRTVYLEFPSKGALFGALCEEAVTMLRDMLVALLAELGEPLAELQGIAETYLRFYHQHRGHYRLLFNQANDDTLAEASPEQRARLQALERQCVGVLARAIDRAKAKGLLRDDVDAWTYAVAVWGAQNGVLMIEEHALRVDLAGATVDTLYWQTYDAFLRGAMAVPPLPGSGPGTEPAPGAGR